MSRSSSSVPLVSVVMPVRDETEFLTEAAQSILQQTFDAFEFIIVTDGAGTQCQAILAALAKADHRIVIRASPGAGIADALNEGIRLANGSLIARMDSDDIALPDRLKKLVEALEVEPNLALIGSRYTIIDQFGTARRRVDLPTDPSEIKAMLTRQNCFAHPAVMFRRSAFLDVGGYRRAFTGCEDFDLWVRLSEHHTLKNLPDSLLQYRTHDRQTSWKDLEHRLLAEVAIFYSAAARREGKIDFGLTREPITVACLLAAGMPWGDLKSAIRQRAFQAAANASNADDHGRAIVALAIAARHGARFSKDGLHYMRLFARIRGKQFIAAWSTIDPNRAGSCENIL